MRILALGVKNHARERGTVGLIPTAEGGHYP